MTDPSPTTRRGRLFVVAAPSGAGKTSLLRALMALEPALGFSVSYTTRKPRINEVEGRDYFFVDHERFERMIAAGEFVEHARVFDNYYGTAQSTVQAALAEGRDLILEIDWQGARQVRARLPEAHHVFILPPSRATLEARLRKRSTDSDAAIARRLQDSVTELSHWREFDYVVINDDFDTALADLHSIFRGDGDALHSDRPGLAEFAAGLLQA
ncbi:MAG: guanylate kinase [Steroidobacteraceae bacterium]|nr:guanylate kinase [Steroidobacteraceae bacterium]MCC7198356.1 guanylate kinase [Gammaproteobacteria bacterium]